TADEEQSKISLLLSQEGWLEGTKHVNLRFTDEVLEDFSNFMNYMIKKRTWTVTHKRQEEPLK
ncbi:hypothetical protein EK904_006293, partial [Melospiza melodia maxima]